MLNLLKDWIVKKKRNAIGHVKIDGRLVWLVERKKPLSRLQKKDVLPETWFFKKTKVMDIGKIKKQIDLKRQVKPLYDNWVGTLGGVFTRYTGRGIFFSPKAFNLFKKRGVIVGEEQKVVLTNKHVVSLDMRTIASDNLFAQPDGNKIAFKVTQMSNKFDAALLVATTTRGEDWIKTQNFNPSFQDVQIGDEVFKSGRTTGRTSGTCVGKGATIYIDYGPGVGSIKTRNCEIYSRMSAAGDSGSIIYLKNKPETAVSLLFAGSDINTIALPITPILNEFNIFDNTNI